MPPPTTRAEAHRRSLLSVYRDGPGAATDGTSIPVRPGATLATTALGHRRVGGHGARDDVPQPHGLWDRALRRRTANHTISERQHSQMALTKNDTAGQFFRDYITISNRRRGRAFNVTKTVVPSQHLRVFSSAAEECNDVA